VGKINIYNKVVIINQKKKIKYGNPKNVYINLQIIDGLGIEFTVCYSELMSEGALTSFTVCDAYCYFVGQS